MVDLSILVHSSIEINYWLNHYSSWPFCQIILSKLHYPVRILSILYIILQILSLINSEGPLKANIVQICSLVITFYHYCKLKYCGMQYSCTTRCAYSVNSTCIAKTTLVDSQSKHMDPKMDRLSFQRQKTAEGASYRHTTHGSRYLFNWYCITVSYSLQAINKVILLEQCLFTMNPLQLSALYYTAKMIYLDFWLANYVTIWYIYCWGHKPFKIW